MTDDVKKSGRMKLDKKKVILVLGIVGIFILGAVGWVVYGDDEGDGGGVPRFELGEEWWYLMDTEGGGENSYRRTRIWGTMIAEGEQYYRVDETRWENGTTAEHVELSWAMSNLSVYDPEMNLLSRPFDFPLEDGKTWSGKMNGVDNYNFTCVRFKEFNTGAGEFKGFKITATGSEGDYIFRYSGEVGYFVGMSYTAPSGSSGEGGGTYDLRLEGHGLADGDGDGLIDVGEELLGADPKMEDTDNDGVIDGSDMAPTFDLDFTLELIRLTVEDKTDLVTQPDVFMYIDIYAGDEYLYERTDTYRNQGEIELNLEYTLDMNDDITEQTGPSLGVGGEVNFWEQKEPAAMGIALDVCSDREEVNGFHFYFTYDITSGKWSLYPRSPGWGSGPYLSGEGEYTVSGLDDGFSLREERPVQDATLEFDMY